MIEFDCVRDLLEFAAVDDHTSTIHHGTPIGEFGFSPPTLYLHGNNSTVALRELFERARQ